MCSSNRPDAEDLRPGREELLAAARKSSAAGRLESQRPPTTRSTTCDFEAPSQRSRRPPPTLTIVDARRRDAAAPSARFDPAETTWASYRDASASGHAAHNAQLKGSQMIVDLDVDVIDGTYRVGAVWHANSDGRAWRSKRDMTGAQFHTRWEQLRRQGFRLHDQEIYPGVPAARCATPTCG